MAKKVGDPPKHAKSTKEERMGRILDIKKAAESDLSNAILKFGDEHDLLILKAEFESWFAQSTTPGNGTQAAAPRTNASPCTDIVYSISLMLTRLQNYWDSPTFVGEVDEAMRVSVERSRAKKCL